LAEVDGGVVEDYAAPYARFAAYLLFGQVGQRRQLK
jgi:hypothetical protein